MSELIVFGGNSSSNRERPSKLGVVYRTKLLILFPPLISKVVCDPRRQSRLQAPHSHLLSNISIYYFLILSNKTREKYTGAYKTATVRSKYLVSIYSSTGSSSILKILLTSTGWTFSSFPAVSRMEFSYCVQSSFRSFPVFPSCWEATAALRALIV